MVEGRQQGFSTVAELAIAKKLNFGVGIKAAIASYDQDACERMGGMWELAFNEMPSWMKANPTTRPRGIGKGVWSDQLPPDVLLRQESGRHRPRRHAFGDSHLRGVNLP